MLILERREDEDLVLKCPDGTKITIKVCEVYSTRVKLGIDAPLSVQVLRGEINAKG